MTGARPANDDPRRGGAAQGLGKILTAIGAEEAKQDRPDLGALVVKMSTGLPSYVGAG